MLGWAGTEKGNVASVRETGLKTTGPRMWDEGSRTEQECLCWSVWGNADHFLYLLAAGKNSQV